MLPPRAFKSFLPVSALSALTTEVCLRPGWVYVRSRSGVGGDLSVRPGGAHVNQTRPLPLLATVAPVRILPYSSYHRPQIKTGFNLHRQFFRALRHNSGRRQTQLDRTRQGAK